jgi:hypothetical protein
MMLGGCIDPFVAFLFKYSFGQGEWKQLTMTEYLFSLSALASNGNKKLRTELKTLLNYANTDNQRSCRECTDESISNHV